MKQALKRRILIIADKIEQLEQVGSKKGLEPLQKAIFALTHNLTDYNQKQYIRDIKNGRSSNAHHALALLFEAQKRAVEGVTDLESLKKGIEREFEVDYPPIKKILKQIANIQKGTLKVAVTLEKREQNITSKTKEPTIYMPGPIVPDRGYGKILKKLKELAKQDQLKNV